ncbi:type II toxin-antitoxin system death-on-curing family toxin [Marinovum sp.]|uniref:type II toxin-antitoxin system death-on-curing family toxin n=1 Tax=Marinovum sp. TaxID=2024839 RepID=UPI002B267EE1|nr:type II toxin-antitoxin system death-on-curing family toxin [Marinovum sp.]
MTFILLNAEQAERLHDLVLNPGELPGRAQDKSLEGALARVDNRLVYGMIGDAFDLAAAYAKAIAAGHCFNDGNKRTAYRTMLVCLRLNGIAITHDTQDIGDRIIRLAQGQLDEASLADWLRGQAA